MTNPEANSSTWLTLWSRMQSQKMLGDQAREAQIQKKQRWQLCSPTEAISIQSRKIVEEREKKTGS